MQNYRIDDTYGVDRVVLFCLSKVEWKHFFWSNMLLTNNTSCYVVLHQDLAQALHLVMGVEMVHIMVQTIHSILVHRKTLFMITARWLSLERLYLSE